MVSNCTDLTLSIFSTLQSDRRSDPVIIVFDNTYYWCAAYMSVFIDSLYDTKSMTFSQTLV